MSKKQLKRQLGYKGDPSLVDVHRQIPRAKGGTYTPDNTKVLDPRVHMAVHGNLREREEALALLKAVWDQRQQLIKLTNKIGNQLLAFQRGTDDVDPNIVEFLEAEVDRVQDKRKEIDKKLDRRVKAYAETDLTTQAVLSVKGSGKVTAAALAVYIDIQKAKHASSLWSYTGLHKSARNRYKKGEASGGNKNLRTALWNTANVFVMQGSGPYREVYDRQKSRREKSEKLTWTNVPGKSEQVEMAWRDVSDGHRRGDALRKVMKVFLADYWFVARSIARLDTRPLYVEEQLGHTGIVRPEERGWKW